MKQFNYGIAFFSLFFMMCRISFLINDLIFEQTGDPAFKQGFFYYLGSIFASIAQFGIIYIVEKHVYRKLHYIPTIITFFTIPLTIFLPRIGNANMITYYTITASLMNVLIPFLYLIVGLQARGRYRKRCFTISVSICLLLVGNLFNAGFIKETIHSFRYISPVVILAGIIFFHYGLILGIGASEETEDPGPVLIEKLFPFTKPKSISDEDIKFFREQTICLVCKSKLSRFTVYLCPECKALYCRKCAQALIGIENTCWACDAPIDPDKPFKISRAEEELVELKGEPQSDQKIVKKM
ncbi:MAG: hypothetical protein ACFFCS_03710 [Candidatus Hodarchaeota archaeon]